MAKITEQLEKYVGTVEGLVSRYFKARAGRRPAPPIPKAEWIATAEAKSEYFTVGISKQEIVPDDIASGRYYIAGYYGPKAITGVLDPQCATAIWIDDNAGKGALALVSIDCVGFMRHDGDAVRARMGQPESKFPTNIERTGNTSSATIPILLDELNRSGMLKTGDTVAMSAFGAGLVTGALIIEWTKG